jgi:AP-1 complex subunit gamma-1
VKLLSLLRILAKGDNDSSKLANDILAQIAASTDPTKNVGTAILYEAVRTILEIETDNSLRILAINTLGRFLANSDNNVRYIALNLLSKAIKIDIEAVQRHRTTIIDCLKDPDISIRRRALELVYALINESNVRLLIRELLIFLEVADNEFKPNLAMHICISAGKYAPNKRWHFDTVLHVLKLAGAFAREEILSDFITLISSSPELHVYMVQKLYFSLKQINVQEFLIHAATWAIGEYGDLLLNSTPMARYEDMEINLYPSNITISEEDILKTFEELMKAPFTSIISKGYILNTLAKLSVRFPTSLKKVIRLIEFYSKSPYLELQQRAVEYITILNNEELRSFVFQRMPPLQSRKLAYSQGTMMTEQTLNLLDIDISSDLSNPPEKIETSKTSSIQLLEELFGDVSVVQKPEKSIPSQTQEITSSYSSSPTISDKAKPQSTTCKFFIDYDYFPLQRFITIIIISYFSIHYLPDT